ncbi:MAG: transporter substrate-binding domain-containing protein [Bacteroidales bacterium]
MNTLKKSAIILFVIISFCNQFLLANSGNSLKYVTKITIASEPDYPPYCIIDKNGKADGFSIELFLAATKAVGIDVEIKIGIWNQIKSDLAEGKLDALPFVGRTPEREPLYDFTLPYLSLHGAVFVRKRTKDIDSISDLKNKTIAVMQGDNAEEFVRRKAVSKNIITTPTFEDAFRKLANNEVDAVITQRVMGIELLKKMKLRNIVHLDFQLQDYRQDFCFAVQKGNSTLLSRLNEGLSIVIADGTYDRLHLKWFGPSIKEKLSVKDILNIVLKVLIPLSIILSLVLIIVLRRMVRSRTKSLHNEISEHKKTILLYHNQQLMLEKMEKVSKVGGWEFDVKTKEVSWTKGVYDIYGVSPDTYNPSEKESDIAFYHPDDQKRLDSAFQEVLNSEKPYDLELRIISAQGTLKWIRTSGYAEIENGLVVRLYGNIMDITERKRIDLEKQETEEKYRTLIEVSPDAILVNYNNSVIYVNPSAIKLFGVKKAEQIINKSPIELFHPDYYEQIKQRIYLMIEKGISVPTIEEKIMRLDKTIVDVEVTATPFKYKEGRAIQVILRDITRRKKAEEELLELKNKLEERVKEQTINLEQKVEELERMNKIFVGREPRIKELKDEVSRLKEQLFRK